MNQPHKHKDLIIAWANGAEIQYKTLSKEKNNEWEDIWAPLWSENTEYRVKPGPKESAHTFRIGVGAYDDGSIYTFTVDNAEEEQHLQAGLNFIGWISDWTPFLLMEVKE